MSVGEAILWIAIALVIIIALLIVFKKRKPPRYVAEELPKILPNRGFITSHTDDAPDLNPFRNQSVDDDTDVLEREPKTVYLNENDITSYIKDGYLRVYTNHFEIDIDLYDKSVYFDPDIDAEYKWNGYNLYIDLYDKRYILYIDFELYNLDRLNWNAYDVYDMFFQYGRWIFLISKPLDMVIEVFPELGTSMFASKILVRNNEHEATLFGYEGGILQLRFHAYGRSFSLTLQNIRLRNRALIKDETQYYDFMNGEPIIQSIIQPILEPTQKEEPIHNYMSYCDESELQRACQVFQQDLLTDEFKHMKEQEEERILRNLELEYHHLNTLPGGAIEAKERTRMRIAGWKQELNKLMNRLETEMDFDEVQAQMKWEDDVQAQLMKWEDAIK